MGTNFYARIIPSKSRKDELKKLIEEDRFGEITSQIGVTYGRFEAHDKDDAVSGEVHLGKRSVGWKFLWNPNLYMIRNGHSEKEEVAEGHFVYHWIREPNTPYYVYPLTKEGIKSFIDRDDVEIYDEYGEKQDKDKFFNEAVGWTTWLNRETGKDEEALDSDSYCKKHPDESCYSFKNEYTDFLESLGYKLSKYKHDFYSDGLRFSTSTDFC